MEDGSRSSLFERRRTNGPKKNRNLRHRPVCCPCSGQLRRLACPDKRAPSAAGSPEGSLTCPKRPGTKPVSVTPSTGDASGCRCGPATATDPHGCRTDADEEQPAHHNRG